MATTHSVMQIGDVAKLAAISVDAIRFYERRSLLPKVPRTPGRFRLYTDSDVMRLNFIKQMQCLGFSLGEVRQLLALREHSLHPCPEVKELLHVKLREVRTKICDLKHLEQHLTRDLCKCTSELKRRGTHTLGRCPILADSQRRKMQ